MNADVFIHTWDKKDIWIGNGGSPNIIRMFNSKARSLLPEEIKDLKTLQERLPRTYDIIQYPVSKQWDVTEITNILKPKNVLVENQIDFENSLINKEGYLLSRGNLNQIKMFYGIKKSFDMALSYSNYDYIIRIRPDTSVNNKVLSTDIYNLKNNTFYAGASQVGPYDAHFAISSPMAYHLSNFIEKMFEFDSLSPYPEFPLYDSHNLFLAWLIESDYVMDKPPFTCGLLATSERKISIEGLDSAVEDDFNNLSDDNKIKILPFIKYLKSNYC